MPRTLYILLYTPGTQFKFCTTDIIWGGLISLSLPHFLSYPSLSPPSIPPSLPPCLLSLPPSPFSLFAVAEGRVKKLEYVDGSSSAGEPLVFASCRGKADHRGENRSVWGRVFSIMSVFPGIDQRGWMRMNEVEVRGEWMMRYKGKSVFVCILITSKRLCIKFFLSDVCNDSVVYVILGVLLRVDLFYLSFFWFFVPTTLHVGCPVMVRLKQ